MLRGTCLPAPLHPPPGNEHFDRVSIATRPSELREPRVATRARVIVHAMQSPGTALTGPRSLVVNADSEPTEQTPSTPATPAPHTLVDRIEELGVIEVGTKQALSDLVGYLLGDRAQPAIGLTLMEGAEMTVLPPRAVRTIVGPEPRIYVVRKDYFLRRLNKALGSCGLGLGQARIWWSGLTPNSDPLDHPLVPELLDERVDSLLEEFARQFDLSRPRVRVELKRLADMHGLAERELERTKDQLAQSHQRLRDEQIARHREHTRANRAEERAKAAEQELATAEHRAKTAHMEETLHALIFREWMRLTDGDRREHPLGPYILMPEIVEQAAVLRPDVTPQRLAWVCAMIACRHVPSLSGIAPQPLAASPGGAQVARSSDGAKGWRCGIKANARGGPRMHYWERPDRTIEFTAIGGHEDLKVRGRTRGG